MITVLSVVTWWWYQPGYRSIFKVEQVNTLYRMVKRHYRLAHRFIVVTNCDTNGLDPGIEVVPDRMDFADLPNGSRPGYPSCYRRLRMFERNAGETFGNRFVSLDMDCVMVGDLQPLWHRPEDFVAWGATNKGNPYNMSMVLMTAGARPQVWEKFDPVWSPARAKTAGFFGSDQAWLCYALGPEEARWGREDGVYSFANDFRHQPGQPLPANARVVFFHGHADPWMPQVQANHSWVKQHYR